MTKEKLEQFHYHRILSLHKCTLKFRGAPLTFQILTHNLVSKLAGPTIIKKLLNTQHMHHFSVASIENVNISPMIWMETDQLNTQDVLLLLGSIIFVTTASNMPKPKSPKNSLGSTGPGNRKETWKGPGGQKWLVFIWNTRDFCKALLSSVVITPRIWTFPLDSMSQQNWPVR